MHTDREKLIDDAGRRASEYEMRYGGCCQSVLAALQETLDLKDACVFKAASALAGGVARRGETCGALIGAIMAICQVVGRDELEDIDQYRKAMAPCGETYLKFEEQVGNTICAEIHKILYAKSFKLCEEEDYEAFLAAGGHEPEGCPAVCSKAARIATDIILDLEKNKNKG